MTSHYQLHLLSQIYELLYLIGNGSQRIQKSYLSPTYQLYLTCKHVIETHYNKEHLSIQEIADDLNVHRSYLTTVFKEFHQISPKGILALGPHAACPAVTDQHRRKHQDCGILSGLFRSLYFSKAFKVYSQLTLANIATNIKFSKILFLFTSI